MKSTVLWILGTVIVSCIFGPIFSWLSQWIVIGSDDSQQATVGLIQHHGFPVWYREVAPGLSAVEGFHSGRMEINTIFWTVMVYCIVVVIWMLFFKKRDSGVTGM